MSKPTDAAEVARYADMKKSDFGIDLTALARKDPNTINANKAFKTIKSAANHLLIAVDPSGPEEEKDQSYWASEASHLLNDSLFETPWAEGSSEGAERANAARRTLLDIANTYQSKQGGARMRKKKSEKRGHRRVRDQRRTKRHRHKQRGGTEHNIQAMQTAAPPPPSQEPIVSNSMQNKTATPTPPSYFFGQPTDEDVSTMGLKLGEACGGRKQPLGCAEGLSCQRCGWQFWKKCCRPEKSAPVLKTRNNKSSVPYNPVTYKAKMEEADMSNALLGPNAMAPSLGLRQDQEGQAVQSVNTKAASVAASPASASTPQDEDPWDLPFLRGFGGGRGKKRTFKSKHNQTRNRVRRARRLKTRRQTTR